MPRTAKPRYSKARRVWYAAIGEPDAAGRRREVFAPREIGERDEAKAWEWFHAESARRTPRAARPGDLTAEELAELYLEWAEGRVASGHLSAKHYEEKVRHLGKFLAVHGARKADTLGPADVTAFLAGLSREYSPNYVAGIGESIAAAFNWAALAKRLPANPVKGFETPMVPRSQERFVENAETGALLRHWLRRHPRGTVTSRYDRLSLLMVRVIIHTGARPKELCHLRWEDIRWKGRVNRLGQVAAKAVLPARREDGTAGHKTARKTGKDRVIYLTPATTRALARVHARPDRHPDYVFVHGRGRGGKGAGEPWESGSPFSKVVLRVRRELMAAQAGIRGRLAAGAVLEPWEARLAALALQDTGGNRLTNYRWRHTAASKLLMDGQSVTSVAEVLGTSADMIQKTYGHLLDDHLAEVADRLQGYGRKRRPG